MSQNNAAIIIYNHGQQALADQVQAALPNSEIFSFHGRGNPENTAFSDSKSLIKMLFSAERPVIGLTATGILIRLIAPLLDQKRAEPPVLVVSVDGRSVVPLTGGLSGADKLAETLAEQLDAQPVITSMSPIRLGLWLERPPEGWSLTQPNQAKPATRRLSEGAKLIVDGKAPWLDNLIDNHKPTSDECVSILVDEHIPTPSKQYELHYVPETLLVALKTLKGESACKQWLTDSKFHACASGLTVQCFTLENPVSTEESHKSQNYIHVPWSKLLRQAAYHKLTCLTDQHDFAVFKGESPLKKQTLKLDMADVAVIGLGPGASEWLTTEAREHLIRADIWVGYGPYLNQAKQLLKTLNQPVKAEIVASDNRVELDRAYYALEQAKSGARVAVISSGDPGIFAMSAALLEAYETLPKKTRDLTLRFIPGLSAFQAAAARIGAPFGHDFALISLSDNLKPWSIIEKRLQAVLALDMVVALYNPASKQRREAVERLKTIFMDLEEETRAVIIAKNIGRPQESLEYQTTKSFTSDTIDMNSLIIIGSRKTRMFHDAEGRKLIYSPRSYR